MVRVTTRWFGVVPLWLTAAALLSPTAPAIAKTLVLTVFLVSIWNPGSGLLYLAGLAPLGTLIAIVFDVEGLRLTEALVLAFLAGSLLRGWPLAARGPRLPRWAVAGGWLFAALALGSVVGLAWRLSAVPGALAPALRALARNYVGYADPFGALEAARLIEGLALAAAVVVLFRTRPALADQVPAVLAASAIAATGAMAAVWRGIGPARLLAENARIGWRVTAHVQDLNAAGSYFVAILGVALGMALRDRGSRRALWLAAAAACAGGLWFSYSKTALAATGIVLPPAFAWAATSRWRPSRRLALVGLLLAVLVGGAVSRARRLERDPTFMGSGLRTQFAQTSLRMIAARPLFGVGVGRYFPDSLLFLSPQLAWTYGTENAHNNFLQIASETGLVGFALFAAWLGGGLALAARALALTPRDWRLVGALAGATAFLGTCLSGHPLLVTEVAAPFWIQFGLVAALGSSTLINRSVRGPAPPSGDGWARNTTAMAAVVAVAVGALAVRVAPRPSTSEAVEGFYGWETGPDGVRYRWTKGKFASIFVPADLRRVEIPMRAPKEEHVVEPMRVVIRMGGADRGTFIVRDGWTPVVLDLPPPNVPSAFNRINIEAARTWRPALAFAGTSDMRLVGVQVGEWRPLTAPGR